MQRKITSLIIIIILLSALMIPAFAADSDGPRLVMTEYTLNTGESDFVSPGNFTLNYVLKNTSSYDFVNTIMYYSQSNAAIVPVPGSTNAEYIGSVRAQNEYSGAIELSIPDNIISGQYRLDLTLNYNNGDPSIHSQLSNVFSIYVNVYNSPGLEIKSANLPERVLSSGRSSLAVEYENPGSTDFKNIRLIIEGNIDEQQKIQQLPILKAGRSSSIEYALQFTEAGANEIVVYFTYEDNDGNSYQTPVIARQTTVEDSSYSDVEITPEITPQPDESFFESVMNSPAFLAMLAVAAIIVVVIVVLIIVRVRKRAARKNWYYKNDNKKG